MGKGLSMDEETAKLLDFAETCYQISDGLFDITSGILGKAWSFDGGDNIPGQADIDPLLELIGWHKVSWRNPQLTLPANMQIDFGGIGKEYAVDRVLGLIMQQTDKPMLVNFGGDLRASRPRQSSQPWVTGIDLPGFSAADYHSLQLYRGALATSGDAYRFLQKDGVRYSHVLNPLTGWPIENAARSVTVCAENCVEAGMLSTIALLQGPQAKDFLSAQEVKFWTW